MEELNITGEYKLYAKKIVVVINDVEHDLSSQIPDYIWRIGVGDNIRNLSHPIIRWRIRKKLSKIVNRIVRRMLHKKNVRIIL